MGWWGSSRGLMVQPRLSLSAIACCCCTTWMERNKRKHGHKSRFSYVQDGMTTYRFYEAILSGCIVTGLEYGNWPSYRFLSFQDCIALHPRRKSYCYACHRGDRNITFTNIFGTSQILMDVITIILICHMFIDRNNNVYDLIIRKRVAWITIWHWNICILGLYRWNFTSCTLLYNSK